MRRVIFNQKGGVGKSTITCNLAAITAVEGKRTLVIDLDLQANTTQYLLGSKVPEFDQTIAHFFNGCLNVGFFGSGNDSALESVIYETPFPNLFVIPAHHELESLQDRLAAKHKIYKLRDAIEELEGFDEIYIDTPPVLNFYTQSALIAAEKCLIPFDCDAFSRESLYTLLRTISEIKEDHNGKLEVEGIIVNQYQSRANLPQKLVNDLISEGHPVLSTRLSPSVKVRESHTESKPLVHFAPTHKLTEEFRTLHEEIHK